MFNQKSRFISLFCLVCFINPSISAGCNQDSEVVIRNLRSGLVLDAVYRDTITLQYYTRSDTQVWTLRPSRTAGLFNILNKYYGEALALDILHYDPSQHSYYNATLSSLDDSENQGWFINSDASIMSYGAFNYALDIVESDYEPDTLIIVYPQTGNPNQQFSLEH